MATEEFTTDEESALLSEWKKHGGHLEHHSKEAGLISDVILGASDGLTVPFALAAGLSGAFKSSRLVVVAVLSELAAGAISMGLGGFLSARSTVAHYKSEKRREEFEVTHMPEAEVAETYEIFRDLGLTDNQIAPICEHFKARPDKWVDFMMKFELELTEQDDSQPFKSALVIGGSYLISGLVPLLPYLLVNDVVKALELSVVFTLLALFVSGYARSKILRQGHALLTALETTATGALAAGAAYFIATLIPQ